MTVATNIVPALIAAAQRRIFRTFREAHATSPAAAIGYAPPRLIERRQFDRMQRAGVIHEIAGRFWLDESRASEWNAARRKRGMIAAAAILAVGAITLGLTPK